MRMHFSVQIMKCRHVVVLTPEICPHATAQARLAAGTNLFCVYSVKSRTTMTIRVTTTTTTTRMTMTTTRMTMTSTRLTMTTTTTTIRMTITMTTKTTKTTRMTMTTTTTNSPLQN